MLLDTHNSSSRNNFARYDNRSNHLADGLNVQTGEPARHRFRSNVEDAPLSLHRFLEYSATILFPFLFIFAQLLSYHVLSQIGYWWLALPGALLGLVFGDFVTGLVHWAADTYCGEETPLIGRSLVKPFRDHHVRPLEICEHDIVETLGNTCILATPLMITFIALMMYSNPSTQQDAPPQLARILQRAGIILRPEHHSAHHTAPFKRSYSITNGWLNPLLNRISFFQRLERTLRAFGIKPFVEM